MVFPPNVTGWTNAQQLSNALEAEQQGRTQWQKGKASGSSGRAEQESGKGGDQFEPFGWVATERDLSSLHKGPLLKALMKHTPRTFSQVRGTGGDPTSPWLPCFAFRRCNFIIITHPDRKQKETPAKEHPSLHALHPLACLR